MERIIVTNPFCGICHMQVCADKDATDGEILAVCNRENPSGTSLGWTTVVRETNAEQDNMKPVVCSEYPERLHFLVSC